MNGIENQLNFMRYDVGMSLADISTETGIPQSTLSYVTRGLRSLPDQYKQSTINAYKRSTTSYLKEARFPQRTVSRFRGYAPDTLRGLKEELSVMKHALSEGAARQLFNVSWIKSPKTFQDYFDEMLIKIESGIEMSELDFDTMKDRYPWTD